MPKYKAHQLILGINTWWKWFPPNPCKLRYSFRDEYVLKFLFLSLLILKFLNLWLCDRRLGSIFSTWSAVMLNPFWNIFLTETEQWEARLHTSHHRASFESEFGEKCHIFSGPVRIRTESGAASSPAWNSVIQNMSKLDLILNKPWPRMLEMMGSIWALLLSMRLHVTGDRDGRIWGGFQINSHTTPKSFSSRFQ